MTTNLLPDHLVLHVCHDGDMSVGISGDHCKVEIDLGGYAQDDRRDYMERVRESLRESFSAVWDFKVRVAADFELPAEYEATAEGKRVSMPEQTFNWWKSQQEAWHTVATALQEAWNPRVLDRGLPGVVDVIKMLAKEANAYRDIQAGENKQRQAASGAEAKPAMSWVDLGRALPPEQKNVVVELLSGGSLMGRNIGGRFAQYDAGQDRFVEWMEGSENGFAGIKRWAEIDTSRVSENVVNSRILLSETLRYIERPETVDVDWLAASIQRHAAGLPLCERRDTPAIISDVDLRLGQVGLPAYSRVIRALAEAKPYVEVSVRGEHAREYPNVYAHNMSRLANVERVLDLHRAVHGSVSFDADDLLEPTEGYVLAFPGAPDAEAEELVETLRRGGNTVFRVPAEAAAPVLREVLATAGIEPNDLQP